MARETNIGRRAAARAAGVAPPRRRPPAPASGGAEVGGGRRGGPLSFVSESIAELKKVEWPGQNQVIQGTVVVLIACLIVGTYLWLNDQLWQVVVKKVFLR